MQQRKREERRRGGEGSRVGRAQNNIKKKKSRSKQHEWKIRQMKQKQTMEDKEDTRMKKKHPKTHNRTHEKHQK